MLKTECEMRETVERRGSLFKLWGIIVAGGLTAMRRMTLDRSVLFGMFKRAIQLCFHLLSMGKSRQTVAYLNV